VLCCMKFCLSVRRGLTNRRKAVRRRQSQCTNIHIYERAHHTWHLTRLWSAGPERAVLPWTVVREIDRQS
jgi:hypothetical protein